VLASRSATSVLVKLTGTSAQRLVPSRDGLQYRYNDELDALLNERAVDIRAVSRRLGAAALEIMSVAAL